MVMSEEVKSNRIKWLEALESGKYKQTKDKLRSHGRYCCLGVWGKISTWDNVDFNEEYLSLQGQKSLNITKLQCDMAIELNDGDEDRNNRFTFVEIAAYFRKIWRMKKA